MISAPPMATTMQASAAARFFNRASSSSWSSSSSSSGMRRTVRCAVAVAPAASGNMYDVLGLCTGATGGEIKAAYRRLALERHPDVAVDDGEDFVRLHDAYATLSDPDARARYDRGVLAHTFARPPATRPTHCGGGAARPRRTWETDQCW